MKKPVAEKPSRAPRGAKTVSQAFLSALADVPEAARGKVAKAAQAMIREELKLRGEKVKASAARLKARNSSPATSVAKAPPAKLGNAAELPKRRGRKPSGASASA